MTPLEQRLAQRRILVALAASLGVHLLAFLVFDALVATAPPTQMAVRFSPRVEVEAERYEPTPPIPISRALLDRLRPQAEGPVEIDVPEVALYDSLDTGAIGRDLGAEPLSAADGGKVNRAGRVDSLAAGLGAAQLLDSLGAVPVAEQVALPRINPVELDAEGRERTVVVVDEDTGRLKKAYLHLPIYALGGNSNPGNQMRRALKLMQKGRKIPARIPLEFRLRTHRLGAPALPYEGEVLDPFHRFAGFPDRQILPYSELKRYPVVYLPFIDAQSADDMARYIQEGGFALADRGQLAMLERALARRTQAGTKQVEVGLGHALFNAHYAIDAYNPGNCGCCPPPPRCPTCCPCPCPALSALTGLMLDDRLVAVETPAPYQETCDCPSNKLFTNALVYGLVEGHRMGGRYAAD